jgi:hypothetical protein
MTNFYKKPFICFAASASSATLSLYPRYNYNMIISSYKFLESNHQFRPSNNTISFFTKHGKNGRYFATARGRGRVATNFVSHLLNMFNDPHNTLINNEDSQRRIESIIHDEYELAFANTTKFVGGINTELLTPTFSKYLIDKEQDLATYVGLLMEEQLHLIDNKKGNFKKDLISHVITRVGERLIKGLCLSTFFLVYTYQDSYNDKNHVLVPVSIKIGKRMFNFYINLLRDEYIKNNKLNITYKE